MTTNPRNPLQVLKDAKQIAKDHGCFISERRGLYLLYRIINGRAVYQGYRSTQSCAAGRQARPNERRVRRGRQNMDFYIERKHTDDRMDEVISFRGEVRMSDLARLRLNVLDHALLDDVGGDEKATPADYLLTLEMIFRRHAEQTPNA